MLYPGDESHLCPLVSFLLFLLLCGCTASHIAQRPGQAKLIEVGENTRVSRANEVYALTEPYVAAHPKNPNHLLVGTIRGTYSEDGWKSFCSSFITLDGGRKWTQHDFKTNQCSDPWVVILSDGTALFSGFGASSGVEVFRSGDGGRTWNDKPDAVLPFMDHPIMITDATGSKFDGSIYLVGERGEREGSRTGLFVTRSTDAGKTFQQMAHLLPNDLQNSVLTPAFLTSGTLVVSLSSYAHTPAGSAEPVYLDPPKEWVVTSTDGGKTFSAPVVMTESCASKSGFASMVVDHSTGPFRDRLYYICREVKTQEIILINSPDRGATWSKPVRASAFAKDIEFRRTPSVVVNKDGIVGVSWYERRKSVNGQCSQDVYFAASLDGGKSFLPATRVTGVSSCPETPGNGQAAVRFPAGGDYSGLTTTSDGLFRIVWADSRDGIYQLFTAPIKVTSKAAVAK